eukprot:1196186-Prorocentrum_minimum.AAC.2
MLPQASAPPIAFISQPAPQQPAPQQPAPQQQAPQQPQPAPQPSPVSKLRSLPQPAPQPSPVSSEEGRGSDSLIFAIVTTVATVFTVIAVAMALAGKCDANGSECGAALGMVFAGIFDVILLVPNLLVGWSWVKSGNCCCCGGKFCCACCCTNPPRAMVVLASISLILNLIAFSVGAISLPYTFAIVTVAWVMFLISFILHSASLLFSIRLYKKKSTDITGSHAEDIGAAQL